MRNEALVAGYSQAGYYTNWRSAPGCCRICTELNGVRVATLKPPLHKGCLCTVVRGEKRPEEALKDEKAHGIIDIGGQEFSTELRHVKQREHVLGTPEYKNRAKQITNDTGWEQSGFYPEVDVEQLVRPEMGKHNPKVLRSGGAAEYFQADVDIGETSENGDRVPTRGVCIRYSKTKEWHAFPVSMREVEK